MNEILQFLQDHGPIIAAWATRELHIWGPQIKPAYQWIDEQGGIGRIARDFFWKPKQTTPPQNEATK